MELASRCAKGERLAMRELYNRYAARLTALCTRYSNGPVEGMDLMHDVMVKAYKTIGKYKYTGEGSLYSWLSKVAVNMAIDRIRKEHRLDTSSIEDIVFDIEDSCEEDITCIPNSAMREMISRLPEVKRLVFNMFYMEGLSHKVIADKLGIQLGSSTSILAKAKKLMSEMIKAYLEKNN